MLPLLLLHKLYTIPNLTKTPKNHYNIYVTLCACSSGDRAKGCGPLGRGFESLQARQLL